VCQVPDLAPGTGEALSASRLRHGAGPVGGIARLEAVGKDVGSVLGVSVVKEDFEDNRGASAFDDQPHRSGPRTDDTAACDLDIRCARHEFVDPYRAPVSTGARKIGILRPARGASIGRHAAEHLHPIAQIELLAWRSRKTRAAGADHPKATEVLGGPERAVARFAEAGCKSEGSGSARPGGDFTWSLEAAGGHLVATDRLAIVGDGGRTEEQARHKESYREAEES